MPMNRPKNWNFAAPVLLAVPAVLAAVVVGSGGISGESGAPKACVPDADKAVAELSAAYNRRAHHIGSQATGAAARLQGLIIMQHKIEEICAAPPGVSVDGNTYTVTLAIAR